MTMSKGGALTNDLDVAVNETIGQPIPAQETNDLEVGVNEILRQLTPAEERIVRLRFGIGSQVHSAQEAAWQLRVSGARARRMEARALRTLRVISTPVELTR